MMVKQVMTSYESWHANSMCANKVLWLLPKDASHPECRQPFHPAQVIEGSSRHSQPARTRFCQIYWRLKAELCLCQRQIAQCIQDTTHGVAIALPQLGWREGGRGKACFPQLCQNVGASQVWVIKLLRRLKRSA